MLAHTTRACTRLLVVVGSRPPNAVMRFGGVADRVSYPLLYCSLPNVKTKAVALPNYYAIRYWLMTGVFPNEYDSLTALGRLGLV